MNSFETGRNIECRVWGSARENVWGSVYDSARGCVLDSVSDEVRDVAWRNVWDSVRIVVDNGLVFSFYGEQE